MEARKVKIAEKVNECGKDVKKLYTLVNNLINRKIDTPFPNQKVMRYWQINLQTILWRKLGQSELVLRNIQCTIHIKQQK